MHVIKLMGTTSLQNPLVLGAKAVPRHGNAHSCLYTCMATHDLVHLICVPSLCVQLPVSPPMSPILRVHLVSPSCVYNCPPKAYMSRDCVAHIVVQDRWPVWGCCKGCKGSRQSRKTEVNSVQQASYVPHAACGLLVALCTTCSCHNRCVVL